MDIFIRERRMTMEFSSEKTTYSINEVSEMIGINTSTLRNWEQEFKLKIPRNNRKHRYYTENEIKILSTIKEGREENHSIETIKRALEKYGMIENQNESALKLMKLEQITVEEFQNTMISKFKETVADIVIEREIQLKEDFERKLEEREVILTEKIAEKIKEQLQEENHKLTNYIVTMREKEKEKKGFWQRMFNK
jgi:DNA-binding transcriptional MerR regulator